MSTAAVEKADQPTPESLLKTYAEICNRYRAIDDFRMKLLGFLPFASVGRSSPVEQGHSFRSEQTCRVRLFLCFSIHI